MKISTKTFSTNVLSQAAVQIFTAIKALIILSIISKTLGGFYYGLWSQMVITITLLAAVLTLRFDIVLVRYFSATMGKQKLKTAFTSMLFSILLLLIPIGLLSIQFSKQISYLLFKNNNLIIYVWILFGLLGLRSLFLFGLSYYRSQYRIKLYSFIQSIQIIGEVLILFIFINYLHREFVHALIGLLIFNCILTGLILFSVLIQLGITIPNLKILKPFLLFSLPLIPNVSLQWIINFSDRYFIAHFLDLNSVGIYAGSYSLGHTITFFISPLAFVLYPTISRLWQENSVSELKFWVTTSLKFFLFFAIPSILGLHYFAPLILKKLATEEFAQHHWLVILIASGYLFVGIYQIFLYLMHLKEKTIIILYTFIFVAAVNIILNILLIPIIGIEGSAIATFISYFLQAILIYFLSLKDFKILLPLKFIGQAIFSSLVMYGFLMMWNPGELLKNVLLTLTGGFIYIICMLLIGGIGKDEMRQIKKIFI